MCSVCADLDNHTSTEQGPSVASSCVSFFCLAMFSMSFCFNSDLLLYIQTRVSSPVESSLSNIRPPCCPTITEWDALYFSWNYVLASESSMSMYENIIENYIVLQHTSTSENTCFPLWINQISLDWVRGK